jgi:hypothetical protein
MAGLGDTRAMWNRIIRPKKRAGNPWRDVAAGCAIILAAIVFPAIDHTGTAKAMGVLFLILGVRWITVGLVHRRDLAKLPNA